MWGWPRAEFPSDSSLFPVKSEPGWPAGREQQSPGGSRWRRARAGKASGGGVATGEAGTQAVGTLAVPRLCVSVAFIP